MSQIDTTKPAEQPAEQPAEPSPQTVEALADLSDLPGVQSFRAQPVNEADEPASGAAASSGEAQAARLTLAEAHARLRDLIDAAKRGAIVPARLAGQLEEIEGAIAAGNAGAGSGNTAASGESAAGSGETSADALRQAKEQASFFGHAIHELRTPMTSIRGYADMLGSDSMGELSPVQKQFIETIRKNSRRMEGLMVDVSDMNKLRAGTLPVSLKMDMFKNIAMMVDKAMTPVAESLDATLTFDIPQGLPLLNTDGEMMAKAIGKLVENGLRYQGEDNDARQVTVRGRGEGKTLIVTVEDNGIGMSADELRQLGTVYYRADNDTVRQHKGSGLGIAVAYGILYLLGGAVDVTSTPGSGTTFTITLPGMS